PHRLSASGRSWSLATCRSCRLPRASDPQANVCGPWARSSRSAPAPRGSRASLARNVQPENRFAHGSFRWSFDLDQNVLIRPVGLVVQLVHFARLAPHYAADFFLRPTDGAVLVNDLALPGRERNDQVGQIMLVPGLFAARLERHDPHADMLVL